MDKVKQMVAAGVRLGTAIRERLADATRADGAEALTLVDLCAKYQLPRSSTSEAYGGNRKATPGQIGALVSELGGTEDEWRELLKDARLAAAHAA